MKKGIFLSLLLAMVFAGGTLTSALAQNYNYRYARGDRDWDGGGDYDNGAARRWHQFLSADENQNFARTYRGNPNVINDGRMMDQWTGVRDLFRERPDVRDYVYEKVRDYNQNTPPREKWNRELEANPNFADRYHDNPDVINDPNLRNNEPEIAEFLRTNPEVRDYVENHHRDYNRSYRDYND